MNSGLLFNGPVFFLRLLQFNPDPLKASKGEPLGIAEADFYRDDALLSPDQQHQQQQQRQY